MNKNILVIFGLRMCFQLAKSTALFCCRNVFAAAEAGAQPKNTTDMRKSSALFYCGNVFAAAEVEAQPKKPQTWENRPYLWFFYVVPRLLFAAAHT